MPRIEPLDVVAKISDEKVSKTGDTMTGTLNGTVFVAPAFRGNGTTEYGGTGVSVFAIGSATIGSTTRIGANSSSKLFFPIQAPTTTAPTWVLGAI